MISAWITVCFLNAQGCLPEIEVPYPFDTMGACEQWVAEEGEMKGDVALRFRCAEET